MDLVAVRILLIASMVVWSPAWCCCAIRAMAAGEACDAGAAFACCSRDVRQDRDTAPRNCREIVSRSCCPAEDAERSSPCRCADRAIEQQRLDTSVKVAVPRADVEVQTASIETVPHATVGLHRATVHAAWAWHPPPRTLLGQSCLLLL